jgi:glycine/D-amino acid oxidase-like deaminating enzyme
MGTRADVIVFGAGMVGVSVAPHLQKRGRGVVLVDRRGAGEETSYGNAGLIQREADSGRHAVLDRCGDDDHRHGHGNGLGADPIRILAMAR